MADTPAPSKPKRNRQAERARRRRPSPERLIPKLAPGAPARVAFFRELAEQGTITHAAKAAGVCPMSVRERRVTDETFEAEFQAALEEFRDSLRKEARRRAVDGWRERPVIDKDGTIVGHVHKFSDALLLALLKKHDPEFRESVKVESKNETKVTHTVDLEGVLRELSPEAQHSLRRVLEELVAKQAGGAPSGGTETVH